MGRIQIPAIGVSTVFVEGTNAGDLSKGPGHYPATPLPGERGTVAIAGHRTTYGAPFRHINDVHPGDRIDLRMPYGHFTYRVERTKIVPPTELSVTDRVDHDRLVLSACHPLYSAAQRIIVFARLDSSEAR
jgi:sortase A